MNCDLDEQRCGFTVTRQRKLLWNIELEMMKIFSRVCEENNINYFLIGGSAIGAVRHKGFIPWDDDIDIGMLREDFEKFRLIAPSKIEYPLEIQYGLDSTSFNHFMRIRNAETTGIIRQQRLKKINHGVFIEIYPFDKVPNSKIFRKIQWNISKMLISVITNRIETIHLGRGALILDKMTTFISNEKLFMLWEKVCMCYNKKNKKMVDTVSIPSYCPSEVDYYYLDDVKETMFCEFEGLKLRIPKGNDRCLKKTYGDYMQLPPMEERGLHHNTEIFYDPTTPYTKYITSETVDLFFSSTKKENRVF